jgi:hypothetical protein
MRLRLPFRRSRFGTADPDDVADITRRYLMYVLLPAWFVPGVADWWMHRRTRIQSTSGARESAIHLLMMAEIGVPMMAALFLEVTPAVLLLMAAAVVVHEATAWWDVQVAVDSDREVRPTEQHIHSFLEVLPFMAFAGVACLHWRPLRALLRGSDDGAWRLLRKDPPLPAGYSTAVLTAVATFVGLPYAEELQRCLRARAG